MNIFEFLRFPDISNNINAVLFNPLKSYRHSALRDSCLKQVPFMAVCQYLNAKVQKLFEIKKEKVEKFEKLRNRNYRDPNLGATKPSD